MLLAGRGAVAVVGFIIASRGWDSLTGAVMALCGAVLVLIAAATLLGVLVALPFMLKCHPPRCAVSEALKQTSTLSLIGSLFSLL